MLQVEGLVKEFKTGKRAGREVVRALAGVSIDAQAGAFFTLLGPSGCGKTTLLRCVAGLETPTEGAITVDGRTLFDRRSHIAVRPNERGLGMVFQSYAVWPHMSVLQNVAFPLRVGTRRKLSKREVTERVSRALAVVQLDQLAERRATDLSGGQQQRLALARALVIEPPLLLLDEPLSNLDAKLREGMRFELKRLQREMGITTIYVTHDQSEALAMSNMIAVMDGGEIEQIGTPKEVYSRPASEFVARFIGSANLIRGVIRRREGADYVIETEAGSLRARSEGELPTGVTTLVSIRPEHVSLSTEPDDAGLSENESGLWKGAVETQAFLGEATDHLVSVGGTQLRARTLAAESVPAGAAVVVRVRPEHCTLLPAAD